MDSGNENGALSARLPVVPTPDILPLDDDNLSWEKFESFCEEFIRLLPGVREVHRYGKRGEDQQGIDFYADRDDETVWTFQCRQRRDFRKADSETVVRETTYPGDRHVVLVTCEVGRPVRDYFKDKSDWDVWDVRDVSRMVRGEIARDRAGDLVARYFGPQWRKSFLGFPGLRTFLPAQEFFEFFLDRTRLFHHGWVLVGRQAQVETLRTFVQSKDSLLAIVVGRGGIGKSKLIQTLAADEATRPNSPSVVVVTEGVRLSAAALDELPAAPCLIVLEDAHRRDDDLRLLLSFVRERAEETKVILSTRPQGIDAVNSSLTRGGIDSRLIVRVPTLDTLTREEVRDLAAQVLGPDLDEFVDALAAATADSPLITVVGGQLLREKKLPLGLLARDEEFRQAVLGRFEDEIVGRVSGTVKAESVRQVLQLLSAVAPIAPGTGDFSARAAAFLGLQQEEFILTVDALEQAGVVLRRGNRVRITPDVLGDHVLHQACLTSRGASTGYADKIWTTFSPVEAPMLLRNLAELDWRARVADKQEPDLLVRIWQEFKERFRAAPVADQAEMLTLLYEVAYFQPTHVLEIIELAVRGAPSPAERPRVVSVENWATFAVVDALPELLRRISWDLRFLPQSCELLWQIGRDDDRKTPQTPGHPIRVLQELGAYEPDKPLVVNLAVLAAVEGWLSLADAHNHRWSPLDILDPLFAKSSFTTRSNRVHVAFRPFAINRETTREIRERALTSVDACLRSSAVRVVQRAVKTVLGVLQGPVPLFGRPVTPEETAAWWPEQVAALDLLENLVVRGCDALVELEMRQTLRWHAQHEQFEPLRAKAVRILGLMTPSFERELCWALTSVHGLDLEQEEGEADWSGVTRRRDERLGQFVAEFLTRYPMPADGAEAMGRVLRRAVDLDSQYDPGLFLHSLSRAEPSYGAGLCEHVLGNPSSVLVPYFFILLMPVRLSNPDAAAALIGRAAHSGEGSLCRAVCLGYANWDVEPGPSDWTLIDELLLHPDAVVRRAALLAVGRLGHHDEAGALKRVRGVTVGSDSLLADALCQIIGGGLGLSFDALTDEDLRLILGKLVVVPSLEAYAVWEFIRRTCLRLPVEVVQFFLRRLTDADKDKDDGFVPLPYGDVGVNCRKLAGTPEHLVLLRAVRDAALLRTTRTILWLPRLFKWVSLGYGAEALGVLSEYIVSGDGDRLRAVGILLHDAPSSFVFREKEFVESLLATAHRAGAEVYSSVVSGLIGSAISGVRTGVPGQPFPRDLQLRDSARERCGQLVVGSPAWRFYDSLASHAEQGIQFSLSELDE